ncbi:unnamed protein product [Rhizophagus irregularis]|nr:unnamed protein product [Rhizophagus irregularis]
MKPQRNQDAEKDESSESESKDGRPIESRLRRQLTALHNSTVMSLCCKGSGLESDVSKELGEQINKCSNVSIKIPQFGHNESSAYKPGNL